METQKKDFKFYKIQLLKDIERQMTAINEATEIEHLACAAYMFSTDWLNTFSEITGIADNKHKIIEFCDLIDASRKKQ